MRWLNKLLGVKPKGEFEVVFSKAGTWDINTSNGKTYNEYCHFDILYNDVTKKYKLEYRGYKPESHSLYDELFNRMRLLNEGLAYHKGGELFAYNEKDVDKRSDEVEGGIPSSKRAKLWTTEGNATEKEGSSAPAPSSASN